MNLPLLRHTFGANALALLVIGAGMVLMGVIMPVMYAAFGEELGEFVDSVPFFSQIASSFGDGDLFSATGSISMGFTHPFTLLLVGIMGVLFWLDWRLALVSFAVFEEPIRRLGRKRSRTRELPATPAVPASHVTSAHPQAMAETQSPLFSGTLGAKELRPGHYPGSESLAPRR